MTQTPLRIVRRIPPIPRGRRGRLLTTLALALTLTALLAAVLVQCQGEATPCRSPPGPRKAPAPPTRAWW